MIHLLYVASLRDAGCGQFFYHRTALRLYGVIEIKPLRGFLLVTGFNLRTALRMYDVVKI